MNVFQPWQRRKTGIFFGWIISIAFTWHCQTKENNHMQLASPTHALYNSNSVMSCHVTLCHVRVSCSGHSMFQTHFSSSRPCPIWNHWSSRSLKGLQPVMSNSSHCCDEMPCIDVTYHKVSYAHFGWLSSFFTTWNNTKCFFFYVSCGWLIPNFLGSTKPGLVVSHMTYGPVWTKW